MKQNISEVLNFTTFTLMNLITNKCPCGLEKEFDACCGAIFEDISLAKTAEQLMRSRYSAFVKANGEYLQKSHHSSERLNNSSQKELLTWTKSVSWVKLDVLKTEKGLENDTEGFVEFKAYFFSNGKLDFIHEKSSFIRENGFWVYFGIMR